MSVKQDYIEAIENLVKIPQDDCILGEDEIGFAIDVAMKRHSKYKPRNIIQKITGTGKFDYDVTDLTYWDTDFSRITRIEYPVDDTSQKAVFLEDDQWITFETETDKYLRFLEDQPSTSEYFRVHYSGVHTCTDDACTVADFNETAVQLLAASQFCTMLSVAYAQTTDSTIDADNINQGSKSEEYAKKAKIYKTLYFNYLGAKEEESPGECVITDTDLQGSWGGDRLSPMWQRKNR